jgi:hypothetical protein
LLSSNLVVKGFEGSTASDIYYAQFPGIFHP